MLSTRDLARIKADLKKGVPDASTSNASLLEIRGPGTMDRTGEVANPAGGALVWAGRVDAHLQRVRRVDDTRERISDQRATVVEVDELAVFRDWGAPVASIVPGPPGVGHTILIEDRRTGVAVQKRCLVTGVVADDKGAIADKVRFELDREASA